MIVNFYKVTKTDHFNKKHLVTKNIDAMPGRDTTISISGQIFTVAKIIFNVDTCEYDILLIRV